MVKLAKFKACPSGGHPGSPFHHPVLPTDFRRMGHALWEREEEVPAVLVAIPDG